MSDRLTLFEIISIVWLAGLTIISFSAPWLPLSNPISIDLGSSLSPPSKQHWSGTDELGRDVLSRVAFASRSTVAICVGATALSIALGAFFGIAAGWFGGRIDRVVGFGIDLFWSIPLVIFAVLIIAVVGASPWTLVLTIGGANWVTSARVLRIEAAKLRRQDFILSAFAYGFSPASVFKEFIFPSLRGIILVLVVYGTCEVLTLESGLAFIGLGLPPPRPTWGGLLASGLSYFAVAPWLVTASSLAITLTLASLQVLVRRFEGEGNKP